MPENAEKTISPHTNVEEKVRFTLPRVLTLHMTYVSRPQTRKLSSFRLFLFSHTRR